MYQYLILAQFYTNRIIYGNVYNTYMEIENFEGHPTEFRLKVHDKLNPIATKRYHLHNRTKTIIMPADLYRSIAGYTSLILDSQVHNQTKFIQMRVNKNLLVDDKLLVYKITKRSHPSSYSRIPCITKFICPHHHKKNPQVRFADGILYCGRCNRVLNKDQPTDLEEE